MIEFSSHTVHSIAWTLLHFLWQGAVLGALFAGLGSLTRNANVRYALGIATLMLMVAAPVVTFISLNRAPAPVATMAASAFSGVPTDVSSDQVVRSPLINIEWVTGAEHQDVLAWLVYAWLLGVVFLSVRTAGGLLWLGRVRRGSIDPLPAAVVQQCLTLQAQMGLRRRIQYGQCQWLEAPAVLGWFRPIVLVTSQALTGLTPQQLQAIIAHELAHIRRHDALVNLFQICVEMLLFYHPAVWWVSRRVRIEREVCCDEQAIITCSEPVAYARALTLMEEWRAAPSMMMAANRGPLTERVVRLFGGPHASGSRATRVGVSIACIVSAVLAGNILVAAAQPAAETRSDATVVLPAPVNPRLVPAPAPINEASPLKPPAPEPSPPNPASGSPSMLPRATEEAGTKQSSYIDRLAAVGLKGLSVDELIAMKVQDISPAYVENMLQTKLHPSIDQLIAMRVQGITPDYVNQTRQLVADLSIDDVIAMKVQGVTPDYIRKLQAAGLDIRVADDFIAAAVHGITPELVKGAVDRGLQDLTIPKLIMLRSADII